MSTMNTNTLISALTTDLRPTRRLSSPGYRLLKWVLVALPCSLLLGALVETQNIQLAITRISDPRMLVELAAILITALTAAYAALVSVQPGRPGLTWALPIIPFLAWLGLIGESCWSLWVKIGDQISFAPNWVCLPSVTATGAVPALAIILMIRRGVLFNAPLTFALATLAASALGAVALRLFHQPDAVALVFLWQLVATVMFIIGAAITAYIMQRRMA